VAVVCWQVVGGDAAARYRLLRIIGTREEDYLSSVPPNSMEDLEQYAEGTAAQLQALQVKAPARIPLPGVRVPLGVFTTLF